MSEIIHDRTAFLNKLIDVKQYSNYLENRSDFMNIVSKEQIYNYLG